MTEMFYAYHSLILDRAAEHGCLDEDVETGDPIVCVGCCTPLSSTPVQEQP